MPDPRNVKRGATMLLNAMQNDDHRRYAMVESIVGEKPHAAVIAATEEEPALLRAILRLTKRFAPRHAAAHDEPRSPATDEKGGMRP